MRVTGQAGLDPGTYDYRVAGQVGVSDPAKSSRAFLTAGHRSGPFIDADTGAYTRKRAVSDGVDVDLDAEGGAEEKARRGDAGHRKACATLSESLEKPPFRSRTRPVGGRRKALAKRCIAGGILLPDRPHTQSLWVIITNPWYKVIP